MSYAPEDVAVVKAFFEDMFGCVVGCGCWTVGWDGDDKIAQAITTGAVRDSFAVIEALERLFAELRAADMVAVGEQLELSMPTVTDFESFFRSSLTALARHALAT